MENDHLPVTNINSDNNESSSDASSTSTLIGPENQETTDQLVLRFSLSCRPFKLPEYPEIAFVASQHFDDPMISVSQRLEGSERVYRFELNSEVPKFGNALSFEVLGKTYNVDLQPYQPYQQRRNREMNLLLTFYGAGQKIYNNISMESFDKAIQNDLGFVLEKATERQKIRNTQIFNGNRYCVIRKPDNLALVPDFLPMQDPITKQVHNIPISYNNKIRNCGRCMAQHAGPCPQLEAFYAAKNERDRMEREKEIKTKIISDSTLRNADQLGLRADVMTMSGGGLGQIVQAAIDDPDVKDKKNIVLMGGTNDVKNTTYESDAEYAQNIKSTITKVLDLATSDPEKKITLVNSHPKVDSLDIYPMDREQRDIREKYLHQKLEEVVKRMPDMDIPIKNVDIIDIEYEIDDTGHPTIEGTKEIIHTLKDFIELEEELIWNADYITSDRKYRGVQSIYRYGCNNCHEFGQSIEHTRYNNGNVCDDCMDIIKANVHMSDPLLDKVRKEVKKKLEDPPLKRIVSDDDEDTKPKNKVQCINSKKVTNGEKPESNNGNAEESMDLEV